MIGCIPTIPKNKWDTPKGLASKSLEQLKSRLLNSYEMEVPSLNNAYRFNPITSVYDTSQDFEILIKDPNRFAEFQNGENYYSLPFKKDGWDLKPKGVITLYCEGKRCSATYPVGEKDGKWFISTEIWVLAKIEDE